jgi:hypothetical protein
MLAFLGTLPGRRLCYMCESVNIGPEPTSLVPEPAHELDEPQVLEKVKVSLNRPWGSFEPPGQGLHLRPADARAVVGVVGQGAVGGDDLARDSC